MTNIIDSNQKAKILGLVFDNFQYIYQDNTVIKDTFNKPTKPQLIRFSQIIKLFDSLKVNPVYGLSACFSYYTYCERKRKHFPILTIGTLTDSFIRQSVRNQRNYDTQYHQGYDTFASCNPIFINAIYLLFNINDDYLSNLNNIKEKLLEGYQKIPLVNESYNRLRVNLLNSSKSDYRDWMNFLLFEGLSGVSSLLLAFDPDLLDNLDSMDEDTYFWYYNGLLSEDLFSASSEENRYLIKFYQLQKEENIIYVKPSDKSKRNRTITTCYS